MESQAPHATVFLTGFMGCGKTTLGKLAADALGMTFCDLDAKVEQTTGKSIAELFAAGEESFRCIEHDALVAVLRDCAAGEGAIVALGGGTWIYEPSRALLRDCPVIFIEVPFDVMAGRALSSAKRPLAHDAEDFRALHDERLAHYRKAAYVLKLSGECSEAEDAQTLVEFIRGLATNQ